MADADPFRPVTGPLRTTDLIRQRAVEALLGQSALNHTGLVAEIRRRFGSTDVAAGALVREPVIEGAAPFVTSGRTFADCAGTLLHPNVIRAIASEQAGDYRFPLNAEPYKHQIEAWQHLTAEDRRSVLVSSGTGSGKTECFLMPLLHDLATEADTKGRLSGVRALALYPLNALIASQEERLRAWTAPFSGAIRFGLYNGLTPERLRAGEQSGPEQVADRMTLRSDPPPILVTNVTMLEYMTVRRVDRPLIENSRGMLRWIILDEAHGYVGSAAAEIALLIRRVLLTFGVSADDVRFVATSATIGEGRDVTDELRRFLRDLSGTDEDRVHVVIGQREPISLPAPSSGSPVLAPAAMSDRDTIARNSAVQRFVRTAEARPVRWDEAQEILSPTQMPAETVIGAVASSDDHQAPLLPLRIHSFLRAVPGLWSCLNTECAGRPPEWQFGGIATGRIDSCPHCEAPVFEVMSCRECGEPYLDCEERDGQLQARITPPDLDEFAALREREVSVDDDEDEAPSDHQFDAVRLAIATRALEGFRPLHVEPGSGRVHDSAQDATTRLYSGDGDTCGACQATSGKAGAMLRPFRYGAPFLIGNAAPVLLDGVPRRLDPNAAYRPPADGRQLLSFTDSRQGTARFAANIQTNAERGFVRGFLYHAVQGSMSVAEEGDPEISKLRDEISTLEAVGSPLVAELIAGKKRELEEKLTPSVDGVHWTAMRDRLSATPEVVHWMKQVWGNRDERYRTDPAAFAEFLLLRELVRRPRRGNTAETIGLARLRFDAIDRARERDMPEALRARGRTLADWQGLLASIVDMTVRANLAVRATWADLHWITARGTLKLLLPPGEKAQAAREVVWPMFGDKKTSPSNLSLILEKALGLDRTERQDRALLNEVTEAAWNRLLPLFTSPGQPGYALDFSKARIAPVTNAWRCPVTRRILPESALGLTQYGHREGLTTANLPPQPIHFPVLPVTFPHGEEIELVRAWLAEDHEVASLREQGVWNNLHDRSALLSPYLRAAEHSAQQPPARLRRFEREFKAGQINILNCSTTMEMGVDIGSVSAVMMTNVPPALANYRQRVGRAGRRRQGFASSLTYTRDTPLDRETFRDPQKYLARETRPPRVKLDSRRIVQRHVNALLLARWFAGAGGEAMKTQAGLFFGCPPEIGGARVGDAPVETCLAWLSAPSTEEALRLELEQLTQGTVLAGDRTLLETAANALRESKAGFVSEWDALQSQGLSAPDPAAKAGIGYQLRRLSQENLLKELAVRGVLPGHGFPTDVVQFVNSDTPASDERGDDDDSSRRRRSFPSRNLDIAIRDYAPGAEVVVDGLVYRSAGVTLNWLRPADDREAREIQSLKVFWTCPTCGAADCGHVAPGHCPACHAEVPLAAQRRFLEPAGFTADMGEQPHADTDEVTYVEPEREEIVARGAAWQPCADPAHGRLRASHEGLVFYSSRGRNKQGYHICLECGRAEPAGSENDRPLAGHRPLRGTKRNADGLCPGNEKPFKILPPIALGHETITDVAELQPTGIGSEGAAWAAVSALREALGRQLGIEAGELGMSVRRAITALGQPTWSLFLFDRNSGGAGFAPQAVELYEALLGDAEAILDCPQPGCTAGCSACVLTADLYRQQEIIDRHAALDWVRAARRALANVPDEDQAQPGARYSRSAADEIARAVDEGAREVIIWACASLDVAELSGARFSRLARRIEDRGAALTLVVDPVWLEGLDAAGKLALRDAAMARPFALEVGTAPRFPNGAVGIAAVADGSTFWASRDEKASGIGPDWGQGMNAPVVRFAQDSLPQTRSVALETLLPASGTRFLELRNELDGTIAGFGERLARSVLPAIRASAGASSGPLTRIDYSDRYLQSPLVVRLLAEGMAGLRKVLAESNNPLPVTIATNPFKPNLRQPFAPDHDWQWNEDRRDVLHVIAEQYGLNLQLTESGAGHGRIMTLYFASGATVKLILDQGFGPWRTPRYARFDFGQNCAGQARSLANYSALLEARGPTYIVVTA